MSFNPNLPYSTATDVDGTLYVLQGGLVYDKVSNVWATIPKSKSGAVAVNALTELQTPLLCTVATIPAASAYPAGKQLTILDLGPTPTTWISDGTYWHAFGGRQLIYQKAGSLATPVATMTLASAIQSFTLPQNLLIPVGLVGVGAMVCADAGYQRGATAAGTANAKMYLGPTNSTTDNVHANLAMAATVGLQLPRLHGATLWSTSTTSTAVGAVVSENATTASTILQDFTTGGNTAGQLFLSIGVGGGTIGDIFNLTNYRVWIES